MAHESVKKKINGNFLRCFLLRTHFRLANRLEKVLGGITWLEIVCVCCLFLPLFVFGSTETGWAQGVISLPKTGQTKCYNESGAEISCGSTGQDGELQVGVDWPNPRFTVDGDCVTDNLTGLMWARNANLPDGSKTWQEALDYVASINSSSGLCGYKDWRLPNVNELESLVNAEEANVATWLNSQGFSNVQSSYYWSSSTSADFNFTDYACIVFMWVGHVHGYNKSDNNYVWLVRSGQMNHPDPLYPANIWKTGQKTMYASGDDGDLERGVGWPTPRFTDHGDGTVTDKLTGLMWPKNANLPNGTKTWQEALDYVKSLNSGTGLGGHHDWRLPNRKELLSLVDRSVRDPALPADHPFQDVGSDPYWSSTTDTCHVDYAWIVSIMWHGHVIEDVKSNVYYVWPVRSGQGALGYPEISVTPNPVEFGSVNVGATLEKQVTVKNDGNANLVIGTISLPSSPFSKATDNCSGQNISAGGSCTVIYYFSPTSAATYSSSSNIPSNDPEENPVTVTLNGTGFTVPAISVSSSSLDFGIVTVGKKITKTLKIANNSSKNLIITISGLEGTDFSIQGSSSVTIKGKKSYTLKVLCKPTLEGIKTATLEIQTSDPDIAPLEISLTATLPATTPDISVAPVILDFGKVKVGKKGTKTIKITNNGTGDLMVTLSGLEETNFSIQGSSSVTIKAKKSYSLKILFMPTLGGLRTATLKIESNDPDTPILEISLSGTGQ